MKTDLSLNIRSIALPCLMDSRIFNHSAIFFLSTHTQKFSLVTFSDATAGIGSGMGRQTGHRTGPWMDG